MTQPSSAPVRARTRAALLLALVAALLLGSWTPAHAETVVKTMTVQGSLGQDGSLIVNEELTFEGAAPAEVVQRLATIEPAMDGAQYNFEITDVKATGGTVTTAQDGDYLVLTAKPSGSGPLTLSYKVKGAARTSVNNQTTVSWRVLQGLSLPVKEVSGSIKVPSTVRYIDCWAGAPADPGKCSTWQAATHDSPDPSFTDGPRGAGEVVRLEMRFDGAAVAANEQITHRWSLDRAFSAKPLPLGLALGSLLLGGLLLWALHRKAGRDAQGATEPLRVAEFRPVGAGEAEFNPLADVRPGHVGTLVDERVDPIDVTATLLDLAVRGHLRITEVPRATSFDTREWEFTRRSDAKDALRPFEETLLNAVAPTSGEVVKASDLPAVVGGVVPQVQSELYDEVVERGWFNRRPDDTRSSWARLGWIALAVAVLATILLVAFTTLGLLGLALIAIALGLVFIGQEMPARTHEGAGVLSGLMALRSDLMSYPTDQMPKGREYEELSQVLPYAIVLGGRERWLNALVAADDDETADSTDLDWYHAPEDWHLKDLPNSLNSFVTHVQGLLFSRG